MGCVGGLLSGRHLDDLPDEIVGVPSEAVRRGVRPSRIPATPAVGESVAPAADGAAGDVQFRAMSLFSRPSAAARTTRAS